MAESDPYLVRTTDREVPTIENSVRRTAGKRLRRESLARGNRQRQEIEAKAPAWKNEPSATTNSPPSGANTPFHPGSYPHGLAFNFRTRRHS